MYLLNILCKLSYIYCTDKFKQAKNVRFWWATRYSNIVMYKNAIEWTWLKR